MSLAILYLINQAEADMRRLIDKKTKVEQDISALEDKIDRLKSIHSRKVIEEQETPEIWFNDYTWNFDLNRILVQVFCLEKLHSTQVAAMNAMISRRNVILSMPANSGKSLCYQLPAILEHGMTLVICPYLSVIDDQLKKLNSLGVAAYKMVGGEPQSVERIVYGYLNHQTTPEVKLLYITPEVIVRNKQLVESFVNCYRAGNMNRIAIEEVHCCSRWSHDYRTDYKYINILKEAMDVATIGVTSTATTSVLTDVRQMLEINTATIIKDTYSRPSIVLKIGSKPEKMSVAVNMVNNIIEERFPDQSGIIYVNSINECDDVVDEFKKIGKRVGVYYSALSDETKTRVYNKWLKGYYKIMIATVTTFGMGIDKPDVRFVIHFSTPKTLDDLYQQACRAGRDRKPATHMVLFRLNDFMNNLMNIKYQKDIRASTKVLNYCLNAHECRHRLLEVYFEESAKNRCNTMCDNCNRYKESEYYTLARACGEIYSIIDGVTEANATLSLTRLVGLWYSIYKPPFSRVYAEKIIGHLFLKGILKQTRVTTEHGIEPFITKCFSGVPTENLEVWMFKDDNLREYLGPPPTLITGDKRKKPNDDDDVQIVEDVQAVDPAMLSDGLQSINCQ